MDFYTENELKSLFASVGERVSIHRSVVLINAKNITIQSDVRIDCFSLLSAGPEGIHIGNHVHIGASTHFFGGGGKITLEDFANISSRVSLFTISDDYKDGFLTNPTIPLAYKKMETGPIYISKHAIIGCGAVVLPHVTLHTGASIGALSLVKNSIESFQIAAGIPASVIGQRSSDCLIHEENFLKIKGL
jgi:galactoside O-acetyltransferase